MQEGMVRIILEVPAEHTDTFYQFLAQRPEVDSFQHIHHSFLVTIVQEHASFLERVKEVFILSSCRELCSAKCSDGTDCLNTAKYGPYCWKHQIREMHQ